MADEIQGPVIVWSGDASKLVQSAKDGDAAVADMSKSIQANLAGVKDASERSFDALQARVGKLATELQGGGATQKLQELSLAVQQVGGASALTETQLDNLKTKIERLMAAGGDAPAGLKALTEHTQSLGEQAEHAAGILEGGFGQALSHLSQAMGPGAVEALALGGAIFTVGAVAFEAAEKFADTFNALQNLHIATGLSVSTLAAWKDTASVTGVSAELVATSMQRLGAQIETGSKKAVEGAQLLGISFEELKAAGPDERMDMIAAAVAKVGTESDTAQAAVKDLFGKAGLGLLPALSADAVQYREHIHELVTSILGDEASAASEAKEWKESVNTVEVAFESLALRMGRGIVEAPKLVDNLFGEGAVAKVENFIKKTSPFFLALEGAKWAMGGGEGVSDAERKAHADNQRILAADTGTTKEPPKYIGNAKLGEGLSVSYEQGAEEWKAKDEAAAKYAATLVTISKALDDFYAGTAHSNSVRLDQSLLGPNPDDLNIQMGRLAFQVEQVGGAGALTDAQLAHTVTTLENLRNTGGDNAYALGLLADAEGEASDRGLEVGDTYETVSGSAKQLAEDHKELGKSITEAAADAKLAAKEEQEAIQQLSDAYGGLEKLMRASAGALQDFGASAHSVGVEAFSALASGAQTIQQNSGAIERMKDGTASTGDKMQLAAAGIQTAGSMFKAGKEQGAGGVLGSTLQGAEMGAAFGPWGAAIGAGAGLLVSGIGALFGGETEQQKIGHDIGDNVSSGLLDAIANTETKDKVSRVLAEMLNSDAIFQETGKTDKIFDLLNAVKLGAVNAKEGVAELGKAFLDLQTAAAGGSVTSEAAMVKMILRAKELGEHIPEIDAAVAKMAQDAEGKLQAFLDGQRIGEKGVSVSTGQAAANNEIFNAVWDANIASQGIIGATQAMQKSIESLVKQGSPLTGGAATAALTAELLKNKDFAAAASGAGAGGDIAKDLLQSGNMSQKTLDAFGTSTTSFYQQALTAAKAQVGADGKQIDLATAQHEATLATLPMLAQMQHAQEMGLKLSPDMKDMLTAAAADLPANTLAEQSLDVAKQTRDGVNKMAGVSNTSSNATTTGGYDGTTSATNTGSWNAPPPGYWGQHASYAVGSMDVPNDGFAMLHANEMVISAPAADFMRSNGTPSAAGPSIPSAAASASMVSAAHLGELRNLAAELRAQTQIMKRQASDLAISMRDAMLRK